MVDEREDETISPQDALIRNMLDDPAGRAFVEEAVTNHAVFVIAMAKKEPPVTSWAKEKLTIARLSFDDVRNSPDGKQS